MSNAISSLYVEFSANTKKFSEAMAGVSKSVREVDKILKPIKDRAKEVGTALTAGVTIPLLALGTAAVASALKMDNAMDSIRATTGKTGAALDQLGEDFRQTLGKVPDSIDTVSTAISELTKRTGAAGKPLQALAKQELDLARITKTEIGETVAASTRVFGDWSIATDKQNTALDFLFKTSQQTGVGFSNLSRSIVQFGAPLRQMGFDFETSAVLLGKFEKEGVNAELVMGSLRIALTKFASAGVTDAKAALGELTRQIQNAGSASEANAIAVKAFGAKAGPDMAAAIREGRFAIDDLMKSIQKSPETIASATAATLSFADKLEIFKNKALLAVEPIGVKLIDAFDRMLPLAERALNALATLAEKFSNLPPSVQTAIIALAAFAGAVGPSIGLVVRFSTDVIGLVATLNKMGLSLEALSATLDALRLAGTIRSFADLSSAISLIGETSVLATAGLVGLAAATGIGIGMFANYILKITGLEESVDHLLKKTVDYIPILGRWITNQSAVDQANQNLTKSQKDLIDSYNKLGIAVDQSRVGDPSYLAALAQQAISHKTAAAGATAQAAAVAGVGAAAAASAADVEKLNKLLHAESVKKAEEAQKKISEIIRDAGHAMFEQGKKIQESMDDTIDKITDKIVNANDVIQKTILKNRRDMGEYLAGVYEDGQKTIGYWSGVYVDSLDKNIKKSDETIKKIDDAYKKVFDSVKGTASHAFLDILESGELSFKKLGGIITGIFRTLATELLSTMTAKFLTPFIQSIGKSLGASALGKLLGGAGGLGGLLGGGGKALTYGPSLAQLGIGGGGTAAGIAAGTGTGAGGAGASIGALATNPITIAVAGAIAAGIAINHYAGKGRRTANEFVQGTENPFGRSLTTLVDSFDRAKKAGTLTLDSAKEAKDALSQLWQSFLASSADFSKQGKTEAKVVEQSMANFAKLFGPNLSDIFDKFEMTIGELQDPAKTGKNAGQAGIPQTGKATSASEIFARAVDRFVAAVDSGSGNGAATAPNQINVDMTIAVAPVFQLENGVEINAELVRTVIMPEITDALETGIRGFKEKWSLLLQNGMTSTTAATI